MRTKWYTRAQLGMRGYVEKPRWQDRRQPPPHTAHRPQLSNLLHHTPITLTLIVFLLQCEINTFMRPFRSNTAGDLHHVHKRLPQKVQLKSQVSMQPAEQSDNKILLCVLCIDWTRHLVGISAVPPPGEANLDVARSPLHSRMRSKTIYRYEQKYITQPC